MESAPVYLLVIIFFLAVVGFATMLLVLAVSLWSALQHFRHHKPPL